MGGKQLCCSLCSILPIFIETPLRGLPGFWTRKRDQASAKSGQNKCTTHSCRKCLLCYRLSTLSSVMKKVRDRIYYTRYFIAFASGIFFCLVNCVLLFILKFLCQADVMLCTLWEKILQGFFFFPYFPENVVLQLLASCIHKQRTDATAFNSSLDPLSPRGRDFFFFFLKDTICERFNVISTWSPHQLCVYHQALKFLWFSLSEWTKYEVFSS